MPAFLPSRSIGDDVSNVKNTFSSWDTCMTKAYCKWPVIIGIIIGSLILISLIWCCVRCLCCGVECCCGCLSCCNSCCPGPRRKRDQGYQQAPPTPYSNQYQPPAEGPPMYANHMGFRSANVAQTATFDAPTKNAQFNEDALPAMPSWDNATSRRVEHHDVEMDNMDQRAATSPIPQAAGGYGQQESLPPKQETGRYYGGQDHPQDGDMGAMAASPYHDHQQYAPSPYETQRQGTSSPYGQPYQSPTSPGPYGGANPNNRQHAPSAGYFTGAQYGGGQPRGYEPSIPPSYHTAAPSEIVSPVSPQAYPGQPQYQAFERRPVQGSWREV